MIREFAKNLQKLHARQNARAVEITQIDKCTWSIKSHKNHGDKPLVVTYEIYALDNSVRAAWLDSNRAFFNGTSMFLRVHGQEKLQHTIDIVPHRSMTGWNVHTGLEPHKTDARGFGIWSAPDYDELVDCPVEIGKPWVGEFTACGIVHRFVVAGAAPTFDGERLLADTQKICEAEIRMWHGKGKPHFDRYLFMLNAVDDGYGGLEHRNSTALICDRRDLPRLNDGKLGDGYITLLGLISHEYFHTWNVKQLRPFELASYDYTRENYTELLWFFEGFTSYYDDLILRRANIIDNAVYLKLLNKTINQVQQAPGRLIQSVADASRDAWIKYYRQDENTPNATISYYTKGALIALCFDLTLRKHGANLDDVMRLLWAKTSGGPMTEANFLSAIEEVSGLDMSAEVAAWVHGTQDLPLKELLESHGVGAMDEPAQMAQRLGLRVTESGGIVVKAVLRGGAAEKAGIASGDEWIGIEVPGDKTSPNGWRLQKLDDLVLYAGVMPAQGKRKVIALISRDKRLLRLTLTVPDGVTTWRIAAGDKVRVDQWLNN